MCPDDRYVDKNAFLESLKLLGLSSDISRQMALCIEGQEDVNIEQLVDTIIVLGRDPSTELGIQELAKPLPESESLDAMASMSLFYRVVTTLFEFVDHLSLTRCLWARINCCDYPDKVTALAILGIAGAVDFEQLLSLTLDPDVALKCGAIRWLGIVASVPNDRIVGALERLSNDDHHPVAELSRRLLDFYTRESSLSKAEADLFVHNALSQPRRDTRAK